MDIEIPDFRWDLAFIQHDDGEYYLCFREKHFIKKDTWEKVRVIPLDDYDNPFSAHPRRNEGD